MARISAKGMKAPGEEVYTERSSNAQSRDPGAAWTDGEGDGREN